MPTKIGVYTLDINPYLYEFFEPIPNPLNFLMTMDYSPWVRKENLAVLEGSNISETEETTPTKIVVHTLDINPYLHQFFQPIQIDWNFLMTMDYSPCPKREIWPFLKAAISPKAERPHPPKLVCTHLTSIHTCMNFLGRFRLIKFFDDHGL